MHIKEVKLYHHEDVLKINKLTGEITELPASKNNNPNVMTFNNGVFNKSYPAGWNLLETQTTDIEFKVAILMSNKVRPITNSLEPLNDDISVTELANTFGIHRNSVNKIFDKLFKLGVYGKFEVYDADYKHSKYWIFNPYLTTNGKVLDRRSEGLFSNTSYAKVNSRDGYS